MSSSLSRRSFVTLSGGALALAFAPLVGCASSSAQASSQTGAAATQAASTAGDAAQAKAQAASSIDASASSDSSAAIGTVDNALAVDEDALVSTYAGAFSQQTYADAETGLSIAYDLYLPDDYDAACSYPMVVFIADSSCVGDDPTVSLTQGRGALVWATQEWQSVHPTIVAVPTYPGTILDDHGSYTTTAYVELTKRFVDYLAGAYAVDAGRVYGTGQSMGCMTTLILAAEYPGLYAGCMFVDGQWDVSALTGLESQPFVYFAAEDDASAWAGAQEVMAMFDADAVSYAYAQWDGGWSVDELSSAAQDLFAEDEDQYFISWATRTIEPVSGGMGGVGGGMGSSSYHMASFDYAYNCVAAMEWLFQQRR